MNVKAINDIGNLIRVRFKAKLIWEYPFIHVTMLTPKEIIKSREFKNFAREYPELTKCALEGV